MVSPISADLTLEELFRRWPGTIGLFNRRGLLCPGCPITPWHTLRDVCAEYSLDEEAILADVRFAAAAGL